MCGCSFAVYVNVCHVMYYVEFVGAFKTILDLCTSSQQHFDNMLKLTAGV